MEDKVSLQDLIDGLAKRKNVSTEEADAFVRCIFDTIVQYLAIDQSVKIKSFGTFKLVGVDSRDAADGATGERNSSSKYLRITFTPDTVLKNQVNKPFSDFETVILNEGTNVEEMEYVPSYDLVPEEPETPSENPLASALNEQPETLETPVENVEALTPAASNEQPTEATEPVADGPEENPAPTEEPAASDDPTASEETTSSEEPAALEDTMESEAPVLTEESLETENPLPDPAPEEEVAEETISEPTVIENESAEDSSPESEESKSVAVAESTVLNQRVEEMTVKNQHVEHQTIQQVVAANGQEEHRNEGIRLSWGGVVAFLLLTLLLMFISFFIGYHGFSMGWFTPFGNESAPKEKVEQPKATSVTTLPRPKKKSATVSAPTTSEKPVTQTSETPTPKPVEKPTEPTAEELAKKYPQVEGGEYWMTGVKEEHELVSGDNLYKLARSEYGDKSFAYYIIVFNQFENPDKLLLGQKVKLPILVKK